jgi:hypothetical protein
MWVLGGVGVLAVLAVIGTAAVEGLYSAAVDFEDPDPPPKPTEKQLRAIRDTPGYDVHWLGREYRGKDIGEARGGKESASLSYGEPYCDWMDGCSFDIDVSTSPGRTIYTEDPDNGQRYPICWRRIGRALALACDDDTEVEVLTGSVRVYVHSGEDDALEVARALRPMKGGGLAAPEPFSCRETRKLSKRLRERLPDALRGCR